LRSSIALATSLLAALALSGCSGGEAVSLESVAYAADRTQSSGSSRVAMELSMEMGGERMRVTADGAFDYQRGRGWMELDLGPLGSLTDGTPASRMTMLFEGDTVWMRVPPGYPGSGGKPWVRTSLANKGMGVQNPDPSQLLDSLRSLSDSVKKLGSSDVRGVETTHYRAALDLQKAMGAAPAKEREDAKALAHLFGGLETVPVDLHIDELNRIRRLEMKYEFKLFEEKFDAEINMDLFDFGVPVKFKRPPASQVADVSYAVGSGG
jgi:hypothetical protein